MSDIDKIVSTAERKAAVQRTIFCPVNGKVLDVRTAVMIYTSDGKCAAVVSPEGWAEKGALLLEKVPGATASNAKGPVAAPGA